MSLDIEAPSTSVKTEATTPDMLPPPFHLKTAQDLLDWVDNDSGLKVQDRRNQSGAIK